jgi:hypothetical protein
MGVDGKSPDINVYTHLNPEYNDIKARLDYILGVDGKSPDIDVWTHMHPEYDSVKRQLDYINSMDGKTPDINVYVHFHPTYDSVKRQLDELARNRTATISVKTTGLSAAMAQVNAFNPSAQAYQFKMPALPPAPTPINIVKVSVDGQQLRATIREELGMVRASDDLLAARGVVA